MKKFVFSALLCVTAFAQTVYVANVPLQVIDVSATNGASAGSTNTVKLDASITNIFLLSLSRTNFFLLGLNLNNYATNDTYITNQPPKVYNFGGTAVKRNFWLKNDTGGRLTVKFDNQSNVQGYLLYLGETLALSTFAFTNFYIQSADATNGTLRFYADW